MQEPRGQITHIAGTDIQIGPHLRQRCGWCGAVIEDHDLRNVQGLEGTNPRPPTWTVGALVVLDGVGAWTIPHEDGAELPDNACMNLDPAVTL